MVRPRRGAIVEIGGTAGLERSTLVLGRSRIRRRQVGVVMGTTQGHARGDWGGRVGEGGRVMHPGAGEAALCQGGEASKLPWVREWAQI